MGAIGLMRTVVGVLGMIGLCASVTRVGASEPATYAEPPMPALRVVADGFGVGERDIRAILTSTGRELWRSFPGYEIEPIVVEFGEGAPITLFQRNAQGEIVIRLSSRETFWCQYAYQFAHEFAHVLCGYDNDYAGSKWFEETLCETASIFAMRAMARAWKDDPPYPNWRDYRDSLRSYADDVLVGRVYARELYAKGMAGFYRDHKDELERNAGDRELNGAMSLVFLHLFEEKPERWEAVRWLNSRASAEGETFVEYLQTWHDVVPLRHRQFVKQVADLYGVAVESNVNAGAEPVPASDGHARPPMPAYRVVAEGFGVSARDIKAVCDSAGRELWRYFPDHRMAPFVVSRGVDGPVVLYRRNDKGETVVRLNTQQTFWCQYAFQFSYLFATMLCATREDSPGNKWFETAVCDAASLFALRSMSKAWEQDPPYPHWRDYRHSLASYAADAIAQRRPLTPEAMRGFYSEHEDALANGRDTRAITERMALVLLDVFEAEPRHWEAVRWLNQQASPAGEPFRDYLRRWHQSVPDRHKVSVSQIGELFGVQVRDE